MSVGEALAQARIRAGLTIEEVSERSLIRASVIDSMENDDYDACGGPIYVNGYIRAIATAIGADPAPLIRSYAEANGPQTAPAAGQGVHGSDHATEPDPPAAPGHAISRPAADGNQTPVPEQPVPEQPAAAAVADEPGAESRPGAAHQFAAADPAATLVDMPPIVDDQPPAGEPSPAWEQPAAEQPAAERQPAQEQPPAAEHAAAEATPGAQPAPTVRRDSTPDAQPAPPAGARPLARPIAPAKATAPQPVAHAQPGAQAEPREKTTPSRPRPAAAAAARPAMRQQAPPSRATGQPRRPRTRERRRVRWAAGLAVLLLVFLGFAGREIFASVHRGHPQDTAAANPVSTHRSAAPSPVPSVTSPASSPAASPSPSPTQPAVQSLTPATVVAFGPAGTSDGDNPSIAGRALSGAVEGWQSSWYTTPAFGDLKQGTGLMVDMGAVVSMTSVAIQLGPLPGANIELGVGDEPVMGAMHRVQQVTGAGGRVVLPLTAVKGRYFLIWFTKLPPDGAGTYQATIRGIAVQGYR